VAVSSAARLPKPDAHLQNPLLPLRRVRLIKAAVGILDAHERRSSPEFLFDQNAIGRGLDQIAVIGSAPRRARFLALDGYQIARFGSVTRDEREDAPGALRAPNQCDLLPKSRVVETSTLQRREWTQDFGLAVTLTAAAPQLYNQIQQRVRARERVRRRA
jgi:hypothetical protein